MNQPGEINVFLE
jgi:hypothetical protein